MNIINKGTSKVDIRDGENIICFDPEEVKDISDENAEEILASNSDLKEVKEKKAKSEVKKEVKK